MRRQMILCALLGLLSFPLAAETRYLVQGCRVLDMDGVALRTFPGEMCLFFKDGSLVSAGPVGMTFFDKHNTIKWEIPGLFHHQLNLSHDGQRILALGSSNLPGAEGPIRWDKIMVISLEGKVLHEVSAAIIYSKKDATALDWTLSDVVKQQSGALTEGSHVNSIHEVPPPAKGVTSAYRPGDIIINSVQSGIFVLSPDLSEVRERLILPDSLGHQVHDVQMSQRGHLIYFNNIHRQAVLTNMFSAIQEYDPRQEKLVFEFTATPKDFFFSGICGGVQELDRDLVMFNDNLSGTYIYSRSKKKLIKSLRSTHFQNTILVGAPNVRAVDLTEFLVQRSD